MSSPILPLLPTIPAVTPKSAASAARDNAPKFADLVDNAKDKAPAEKTPATDTAAPAQDAAADAPKDTTTPPAEATPEVAADDKDTDTDVPSLDDVIDALAALDLNLQTGQQIDPALLDKLNTAAQQLAALLGVTTPVAGAATPATDTPASTPVDPSTLLGQLTKKIGELAASASATAPELADKLNALAQKLASGEVSADMLAKLGFDAELKAADPAVNQAIAALVNSKTAAPKEAGSAIKAPELKVADTTLLTPAAPGPVSEDVLPTPAADKAAAPTQEKAQEQVRDTSNAMAKATVETGKDAPEPKADPLAATGTPANAARTELPVGARVIAAAYQGPPSPINMPHMAFEIARQVHAGSNKFQIRLDPADLGRVDVTLDIDKNGTVNARLVVERTETLDLMQRDQRALEKALQQAGLDGAKTNLEFSLKQNPSGGQDSGKGSGSPFGTANNSTDADDYVEPVGTSIYRGTASPSGVNIFV